LRTAMLVCFWCVWAAADSVDKFLHVSMETERWLPSWLVLFAIFWWIMWFINASKAFFSLNDWQSLLKSWTCF
jgi:hypothetical protein